MRMKVRALIGLLFLVSLGFLVSCGKTSSSVGSGTGFLFVTTRGDNLVSPFTINLGTGVITAKDKGVTTGNAPSVPTAMVLAPSGSALFVANSNPGNSTTPPAAGNVTSYTVNADGTLTAVSASQPLGINPSDMAIDPAGHFLFVANQGVQSDMSGTISVFSVQGTTLTEMFQTPTGTALAAAGPVAVAVTPDAKFLYVANQFDASVTEYSVDQSSGALTPVGVPYPVRTTPSALAVVVFPDTSNPTGEFLYVANTGSNNVSAFAICDQATASCNSSNVNNPDGALTEVPASGSLPGSPFPAGTGPVSIAADPSGTFLYVADKGSNQVSEYKIGPGNGFLTALSSPTISTGATPVWLAIRAGTSTVKATGGTTNFLYVANMGSGVGSSSISAYAFDSTTGALGVVGAPVTTGVQPSAIAVK